MFEYICWHSCPPPPPLPSFLKRGDLPCSAFSEVVLFTLYYPGRRCIDLFWFPSHIFVHFHWRAHEIPSLSLRLRFASLIDHWRLCVDELISLNTVYISHHISTSCLTIVSHIYIVFLFRWMTRWILLFADQINRRSQMITCRFLRSSFVVRINKRVAWATFTSLRIQMAEASEWRRKNTVDAHRLELPA